MKTFLFIISMLLSLGAVAQSPKGIFVDRIDEFSDLESRLRTSSDSTYVVNFWATWCKPCVKELPYFEQLHADKADNGIKVILVSLDFKRQIDTKLIPFVINKKIQSEVVALLDTKTNTWIDQVDPSWSGSIPATLIFNKEKKLFLEQSFESYEELTDLIESFETK